MMLIAAAKQLVQPRISGHVVWQLDKLAGGRQQQAAYCGMSTNRENIPWNATVMVSVGPLRCFATIRSASP